MKIKFLITFLCFSALILVGLNTEGQPRAQEIVYEGSVINADGTSSQATAQIAALLKGLGAEEITVEKKEDSSGFKISFVSDRSPSYIEDQIDGLLIKSSRAGNTFAAIDIAVAYEGKSNRTAGSGCHGTTIKEFTKEHLRNDSFHQYGFVIQAVAIDCKWRLNHGQESYSNTECLVSNISLLLPDSRAGPLEA